ncbi:MAG: hypothetical protein EOO20_21775 [Chryseobacterium sp.]|nr:MAG: hypothetical protein EOO20_21775 [Chryseobacterium sp.]
MSWTNFTLYLILIYVVYYAVNLLMDFSKSQSHMSPGGGAPEEHYQIESPGLTIDVSDISEPDDFQLSAEGSLNAGDMESSGALRFEQIMQAASQELIECTKRLL